MKRLFFGVILVCVVLILPTPGFSQAAQPEYSLDDHPSGPPLTGPWVGPPMWPAYASAEDEFGLGLPANVAGFVGPSPILLPAPPGPFFDSDILVPMINPGAPPPLLPALFMRFAPNPPPFYVDAISCNHVQMVPCPNGLYIRFSVDRATGGVTNADASYNQAFNNEQPGDIFRTDRAYTHVGWFCPYPPPVGPPWYLGPALPTAGTGAAAGAFNQLMFDHYWNLGLGPVPPCLPIAAGTHDNVDAFNEWPMSIAATSAFFALSPASAIPAGFSPADIFRSPNPPGGLVMPAAPFAAAAQMGLDTYGFGTDSIDGIAFWDNGMPGVLEPGIDYVAFTLAPGSATLTNTLINFGILLTAGDVFVTDFNGFFSTYLIAGDLGVGNNPNVIPNPAGVVGPLPVIGPTEINVDALDLTIDPDPVPFINPITNPNTNPQNLKLQ